MQECKNTKKTHIKRKANRVEKIPARSFNIPASIKEVLEVNLKGRELKDIHKHLYVVDSLMIASDLKGYKADSFKPLQSETLRKIVTPPKYSTVMNNLISWGIIEKSDDNYIVGVISYKYRIHPDHLFNKRCKLYSTDKPLNRKIWEWKNNQWDKKDKTLQHLHFCLLDTKIDHETALAELEELLDAAKSVKSLIDTAGEDKPLLMEQYQTLKAKYHSTKSAILRIKDKDFNFSNKGKGGRLDTNITNLSSDIRKHLISPEGEVLVNIDIKCSQPFLLNILLKKFYSEAEFNSLEDVQKYYRLTTYKEGEDFYYFLMNQINEAYKDVANYKELPLTAEARKKFKGRFFNTIFYNNDKLPFHYKEWKVFKNIFPNVAKVVKYNKQADYRNLPINLQKAESDLIIKTTCTKLANENSPEDLYLLTIHDSIVCTASNAEYVKEVLLESCEEKYGLTPHLTIEALNGSTVVEEENSNILNLQY